jgi:hypothetical protein
MMPGMPIGRVRRRAKRAIFVLLFPIRLAFQVFAVTAGAVVGINRFS